MSFSGKPARFYNALLMVAELGRLNKNFDVRTNQRASKIFILVTGDSVVSRFLGYFFLPEG